MALLAVACLSVLCIPVVVHLVSKFQAETFALMLEHLQDAARIGEPKDVTEARIALERQKLELQHLVQQELLSRRAARSQVDLTS